MEDSKADICVVRSEILKRIKENLAELEVASDLSAAAAARSKDLYSKGPPGDNYAKNTSVFERAEQLIDPADTVAQAVLERIAAGLGK